LTRFDCYYYFIHLFCYQNKADGSYNIMWLGLRQSWKDNSAVWESVSSVTMFKECHQTGKWNVAQIKGTVIRATFSCNVSRNNVALQVEVVCCAYYHFSARQIFMLQKVKATWKYFAREDGNTQNNWQSQLATHWLVLPDKFHGYVARITGTYWH